MRVKMRSGVKRLRYGYKYEDEYVLYSITVRIHNVDKGVLVSIQVGVIYTVHTYFNYSLNFVS